MSHDLVIASRPRRHSGYGGISKVASTASIARTVWISPRSKASANRSAISLSFSVAERPQSLLLTSVRQPFLDRDAGTAECAIDRGHGSTQRLCGFLRGEAQHVAQDKRRPLGGQQV